MKNCAECSSHKLFKKQTEKSSHLLTIWYAAWRYKVAEEEEYVNKW